MKISLEEVVATQPPPPPPPPPQATEGMSMYICMLDTL